MKKPILFFGSLFFFVQLNAQENFDSIRFFTILNIAKECIPLDSAVKAKSPTGKEALVWWFDWDTIASVNLAWKKGGKQHWVTVDYQDGNFFPFIYPPEPPNLQSGFITIEDLDREINTYTQHVFKILVNGLKSAGCVVPVTLEGKKKLLSQ